MRRFLAGFVAAALLALAASACSTTLTDAATIRYSVSGDGHEDHITRSDLVDEVRKIVENKPFATWLNENGYAISGDETAGSAVASTWLSQLIRQKAVDALFVSRRPRGDADDPRTGDGGDGHAGLPVAGHLRGVRPGVPRGAHRSRGASRGRRQLVRRHLRYRRPGILRRAQGGVRLRVGQERGAHPRAPARRKPGSCSASCAAAATSGSSRRRTPPTRAAPREAARSVASLPAASSRPSSRPPTKPRSTRRWGPCRRSTAITSSS